MTIRIAWVLVLPAFPLELSTDIEVAFKDVLFEQISAALSKGVSLTVSCVEFGPQRYAWIPACLFV